MSYPSPLQSKLEAYAADMERQQEGARREGAATGAFQSQLLCEFLPWGNADCEVLATTGIVELEYAAIQKSVGVFDAPCRGTILLRGEDRFSFIDRMSTQKLIDLKEGEAKLAFIVNRKGSIVADVVVRNVKDYVLVDFDITVAEQLCNHFKSYIVMDDVTFENVTKTTSWLWCLGSKAISCNLNDVEMYALPKELLGIEGVAIAVHPDQLEDIWQTLIDAKVQPIGWYAINMSRIENGAAIFLIDFDSENLPHETNLIESRVRFDKGCYLGQEIVARMENLGQPKCTLLKLEMKKDVLPIAGAQLWENNSGRGTPVGVITSSAVSPKSGGQPAVIAMIGKKYAKETTSLHVHVGSELVECVVRSLTRSKEFPT
ncbi:MAG: hypothetical protein VX436_01485 [Planctomycetota bacterium]|nr:hypothetical protein [Planctomycetota bacterium]